MYTLVIWIAIWTGFCFVLLVCWFGNRVSDLVRENCVHETGFMKMHSPFKMYKNLTELGMKSKLACLIQAPLGETYYCTLSDFGGF